jgi:2-hydroxy-3-keto-5-methylthiopentenyl-1-phosphate phosphatase
MAATRGKDMQNNLQKTRNPDARDNRKTSRRGDPGGSGSSAAAYVVLCDFDGTVSTTDVGNRLFARFASDGWAAVVQRWKEGEIGSRDCLMAECSLARATPEQVKQFALAREIDPHFKPFVQFCRDRDVDVIILSDGLDFYIDLLLKKYGLEHLEHFANHLQFHGDRLIPSFPYFELGCRQCGNCKGYHVRRYRQQGRTVIYIGDGFSDRCGVREADHVLAKGDLQRYCREQGIAHQPFEDFRDVLEKVHQLMSGDPAR